MEGYFVSKERKVNSQGLRNRRERGGEVLGKSWKNPRGTGESSTLMRRKGKGGGGG